MNKRKKNTHKLLNKKKSTVTRSFTFAENRKGKILSAIIVFCVPVLLYLQTITFGFINFDDDSIITDNINFLKNFQNAPQAFLTDAFLIGDSHFYRPMQTLSYMVDIQLSGVSSTWMFHLTNILLLGCIAYILFLVLLKFQIRRNLAIISTLIYCAHPLFVSNVAWIPARGDLQLMLFSLLAFLFFIEFLKKNSLSLLFLSWAAFIIALFSKETAVILPLIFIIYYFAFTNEKRFENKYALFITLYTFSGIFWFWLRSKAIGDFSNSNDILDVLSKNGEVGFFPFLQNLQTIPESLTNFFFPFDIDPIPSFTLIKTVIGSVIMVLMGFLLFKKTKTPAREKIFGILWFLLLLIPPMFFKPFHFDYLHHRFFLPLVGILLFVLYLLPKKWFNQSKNTFNRILLALFLIFSAFTFIKSKSYTDPMTFYNSAIANNSKSDFAYIHRGYLYETQGSFKKSIADFSKAIEINPNYAEAYNNRGNVYNNLKQYDKAIADFSKAIDLKPDIVVAYNNRGLAYVYKEQYAKAIDDYTKVIELKPDLAEGYNNLGMAYGNQGIYDKALDGFAKAIELKPDYAQAYNNRGMAYVMLDHKNKACQDFTKAEELGNKEALSNLVRFCK